MKKSLIQRGRRKIDRSGRISLSLNRKKQLWRIERYKNYSLIGTILSLASCHRPSSLKNIHTQTDRVNNTNCCHNYSADDERLENGAWGTHWIYRAKRIQYGIIVCFKESRAYFRKDIYWNHAWKYIFIILYVHRSKKGFSKTSLKMAVANKKTARF